MGWDKVAWAWVALVLCALCKGCVDLVWSMLLATFALKNTILHNKA
jgi:hypothetical protein